MIADSSGVEGKSVLDSLEKSHIKLLPLKKNSFIWEDLSGGRLKATRKYQFSFFGEAA